MRNNLIEKLCCPFDKKELMLQVIGRDISGNIIEGMLTCTSCKRYYPIIHGIPIMNPDEYRERQLEMPILKKWENKLKADVDDRFRLIETNPNENSAS